MKPGDVQLYGGDRAIVAAFGLWVARGKDGWLHIHMTGDNRYFKHVTVVNNPSSKTRYNRVLFRDLRRLLVANGRWSFAEEGSETER